MTYFYFIVFLFVSILIKIPIFAIVGGIVFSLIFKTNNEFISKKYSSIIIQIGVVLLGFSINYQAAINSSLQYIPVISIFVVLTFILVFLLGLSRKIDKNYSLLVASGSSICGGTAMVSIAPIIKSKNEDLAAALSIIFILNALGIFLFPFIPRQRFQFLPINSFINFPINFQSMNSTHLPLNLDSTSILLS